MMYLLYCGAFYFVTYAFYISPHTDYLWLCRLDSVSEPMFLCTMALFIVYIHLHINENTVGNSKQKKITARNMQWFITPAIAFGAVNLIMYYLVGYETASEIVSTCDRLNAKIASPEIIKLFRDEVPPTILKLHGLFNQTIYGLMAGVYVVILVVSCVYCSIRNNYRIGDIFRFFCMGSTTSPARAASACTMMVVVATAPLLIMGRTYFVNSTWPGVAMTLFISISLFILANAEMMSQRKTFTIHDIVTSSLAESGVKNENDNENENDNGKGNKGDLLSVRTKHIVEKIHDAFEKDKIYTDPELTVGGMAEMIGTNRTTLSNIINQEYGITFRDLTNHYRIEAAKTYIRQHPTATQEEIAVKCGFRSASALNHKFKEVTGLPPTLWLTSSITK